MITAKAYSQLTKCPKTAFLYMPDVMNHVLKGDTTQTIYKDNSPSLGCLADLKKAIAEQPEDPAIFQNELEAYQPLRRHREHDADTGTLDIERYLNGDKTPFTDVFSEQIPRPAKTILIDANISSGERYGEEMRERHRLIYAEALKAEAEGIPLRVIACDSSIIDECKYPVTLYFVVKDWNDPIFPEIWQAMKDNTTANDFGNVFEDFLIGTHSPMNGSCVMTYVGDDFPEDEELIIINAKRITREKRPA